MTLAIGLGDDGLGAGFIAFLVVLALAVSSYFLFRSMTRHIRNVPSKFDESQPPSPPPAREESSRR